MKYIPALVAMVLSAPAVMAADVPHSELSLAGVSLDLTEPQVRERLGVPVSVSEELDHLNRHLQYPDLLVSFSGEVVEGLYSRSPKACTPSGLCPGDRLDRATAVYGAPEVAEREAGTFWEYYTSFPCWLQVAPEGDRVGSIRVVCQP
jgi:hypothetical protein